MSSSVATTGIPSLDRPLRLGRALLIGNLVVALLLGLLATLALRASHAAYAQRAREATEALAASLQHGIAAELAQVDLVLRNVRTEFRRVGSHPRLDPSAIETSLSEQLALIPGLESLRITDAQGIVRHGQAVSALSRVDLSDRDFFRRARDDVDAGLVISEPVQARISKKWVIALARRLEKPDGSFDGVVYANLSTEHFQQMFASVDVGDQGAISLRSSSFRLIARYTPDPSTPSGIGSSNVSSQLAQAVRQNPTRGFYVSPTALDQIERGSAYQQVGKHPLIVLVGLGTSEYFAPWRIELIQVSGLIAVVMLLIAGASWLVYGAWRREADSARALSVQGRRNQALMHAASDGLHILNAAGEVEELSASFAQMLGRTREDLLGQHVTAWDAQQSPQTIQETLRTLASGEACRFETRHRHRDGTLIDVEIQAAAVQIDARTLIYCSARDITEHKQTQELQLKSVQLQAENRQLHEAGRLKKVFLGNMSHELRTPLNAILGFVHLLKSGSVAPDSPRHAQYLDRIDASSKQLLGLINALLQFSNTESHKFELKLEQVDLRALIAGVSELFEPDREHKRLQWHEEIDPALGHAVLDPLRLEQMLCAYFSNAIKFTPEHGHVTVRVLAQGTDDLRIEVEDTGIGIAPADLPRVFMEFQQLSDGHARQYEGVGIGLALTRRLVEAQGGHVGVRSQPGVGSVFHIVLPQVLVAAQTRDIDQRA